MFTPPLHWGTAPAYAVPHEDDIIVRQSTHEGMKLCPARYKYYGKEGFVFTPSLAATRGTVVHTLIEMALSGASHKLTISQDVIIKAFNDALAIDAENNDTDPIDIEDITTDDSLDKLIDDVRAMITAWRRTWNASNSGTGAVDILGLEEKIVIPVGNIDGRGVWFQGTIDAIVESVITRNPKGLDWKTSTRKWPDTKAHGRIQHAFYALLYLLQHGRMIHDWAYWVVTVPSPKLEPIVQRFNVRVSEEQIRAVADSMWNVGKVLAYDAFVAKPSDENFGKTARGWYCSPKWCGAWNICTDKALLHIPGETLSPVEITTLAW